MSNSFNPYQLTLDYSQQKADFSHSALSDNQPIIYYNSKANRNNWTFFQYFGLSLIIFSIGALFSAIWPFIKLDLRLVRLPWNQHQAAQAIESDLRPLTQADGTEIKPVNKDFSIIIPTIGVNAPIIAGVNPVSKAGYTQALLYGVAHSSTSYYPNQNGTVYLFSHSTNYEWYVKDLNAVFYLLKNVKLGDYVVLFYLGNRYTYAIRESKVVSAKEVSYLTPQYGKRELILQTCWPPGTAYERMLVFADLVEEKVYGKFSDIH
jgi:LPXTG-site transpeptidase (sortase) family protein